jgi:hypothetical protein
MSGIFGGSKKREVSENVNRTWLNDIFGQQAQTGVDATNSAMSLLQGDATGFDRFKDAVGFDWQAERGSRGITGNAAARGLLRSGPTGQALVEYGNQIQNQFANQYLQQLLGVSQAGLGAGGILEGAGRRSESNAREKPGIGKFIGQIGSGFAGGFDGG